MAPVQSRRGPRSRDLRKVVSERDPYRMSAAIRAVDGMRPSAARRARNSGVLPDLLDERRFVLVLRAEFPPLPTHARDQPVDAPAKTLPAKVRTASAKAFGCSV